MDLYYDHSDRIKYIDILVKVREKFGFRLHAYCLMTNHTHLLVEDRGCCISEAMKSVGIRYAAFLNKKANRVGSLFQDRFRSEVIDSERQFLACARYIHNNPVKAGICQRPEAYKWSSYREYIGKSTTKLLTRDLMYSLFAQDPIKAREGLVKFTSLMNEPDEFLDYVVEDSTEVNLVQALKNAVRKQYHCDLHEIKSLSRRKRNEVIRHVKELSNLSCRELAEILSMSKDMIFRA